MCQSCHGLKHADGRGHTGHHNPTSSMLLRCDLETESRSRAWIQGRLAALAEQGAASRASETSARQHNHQVLRYRTVPNPIDRRRSAQWFQHHLRDHICAIGRWSLDEPSSWRGNRRPIRRWG
ncbi:hypothetical protein VFPFJ_05028 [Purpureocillium lilacinum]|uniref:Uncharacterized protein n=1 Tax=Purpureocillium lilacinum TaxID=33203 RepID=A0A179H1E5_PURLI|nr:hypothetical protein VFPFJ_05028 [Purpureocillium lilacinum]OAQ84076.1 hypothetical protein VFPBJ_02844 [Purpureocillium lilacinum]OAQ90869.1 hypothetical protein VFPFJ_05028 [Purpureocillium lilacinum]